MRAEDIGPARREFEEPWEEDNPLTVPAEPVETPERRELVPA